SNIKVLRRPVESAQYCSEAYRQVLSAHGFLVSMSRKRNCWDNAVMESFFKTLKAELMWRQAWSTRQEVEQAITLYINNFYNAQRRHSALQWKSPLDHERNVA
ncbi:integrase core domain-containing protein, partial [Acetobacter orientalis]|uniref:integrase core domain-containing protein n=1 Tax=Acetobacter orientalis TaxID=146474 RepID=UPI0039E769DF